MTQHKKILLSKYKEDYENRMTNEVGWVGMHVVVMGLIITIVTPVITYALIPNYARIITPVILGVCYMYGVYLYKKLHGRLPKNEVNKIREIYQNIQKEIMFGITFDDLVFTKTAEREVAYVDVYLDYLIEIERVTEDTFDVQVKGFGKNDDVAVRYLSVSEHEVTKIIITAKLCGFDYIASEHGLL